jgi:hypothetical protein
MKTFYSLVFILSALSSSGQVLNSDSINIDSIAAKSKCYIVTGSSGGFSGQIVQHYFFSDGNIYRSESLGKKNSWVKKLSKKETKIVFKKLKALHLEKVDFNHPGNMTYFIEQHKNGIVNSIKWGDNKVQLPSDITTFHRYLMDIISTQ